MSFKLVSPETIPGLVSQVHLYHLHYIYATLLAGTVAVDKISINSYMQLFAACRNVFIVSLASSHFLHRGGAGKSTRLGVQTVVTHFLKGQPKIL